MSIGGVRGGGANSWGKAVGSAAAAKGGSLADKIYQVSEHCMQTLKLLESHEANLLTGKAPSQEALQGLSDEIGVLKDIVWEHKSDSGEDPRLATLLSEAEVRLRALELRFQKLQTYGTTPYVDLEGPRRLFANAVKEGVSQTLQGFKHTAEVLAGDLYPVKRLRGEPETLPHERVIKAVELHEGEVIDPKLLPFLAVSYGDQKMDAMTQEISEIAAHVLTIEKEWEEAPKSKVHQRDLERLHDRVKAVGKTLKELSGEYPKHLSQQLERQLGLLESKLNSASVYQEASSSPPEAPR